MKEKLEEVKNRTLEFVRTHNTENLLIYLLDNLPKDSYEYKSFVLIERRYKHLCQSREEKKIKEGDFLQQMNRIDFSILNNIENIGNEIETKKSAVHTNEVLSFDDESSIWENLKNNWLHMLIALAIVTYIILQII